MHDDNSDSDAAGNEVAKPPAGTPRRSTRQTRAERLAAELRANLRKRKALARTRGDRPDGGGES